MNLARLQRNLGVKYLWKLHRNLIMLRHNVVPIQRRNCMNYSSITLIITQHPQLMSDLD